MILLSFDIEEFDMPFEYGVDIPFDQQLAISVSGTYKILQLLANYQIKATFYCTANFAIHCPEIIQKIVAEGHEIASHGYWHSEFEEAHLLQSKLKLEEISHTKIEGYRMARMMPVSDSAIEQAGYIYNSSINPTYIPGRYNKFNESRTYFKRQNVWQLPASVSPCFRFPLFWLSFHNLPLSWYQCLVRWTYRKDGYLNVYFHPWEFEPIGPKARYNFPSYVTQNTNEKMVDRLDRFIRWAQKQQYPFGRTIDFINNIQ